MPERFPLVVTPLAQQDIDDAASWYEARVTALGLRFVESLDESFELVSASPQSYPVVHRDIRRILIPGFPYAMFFVLRDNTVRVIACMHTRRHPKRWQYGR